MTKKDLKEKEHEECLKKIEECENKYKRVLADYQNLEKRTIEEKREWARISNKELILRLLPVLDTLEMAQKHVNDEGLKLSIKNFLDVLISEGVEKIEAEGKDFDPGVMECIDTKEGEENKVLEVARDGYKMSDKVLRPVQVRVGKKSDII